MQLWKLFRFSQCQWFLCSFTETIDIGYIERAWPAIAIRRTLETINQVCYRRSGDSDIAGIEIKRRHSEGIETFACGKVIVREVIS